MIRDDSLRTPFFFCRFSCGIECQTNPSICSFVFRHTVNDLPLYYGILGSSPLGLSWNLPVFFEETPLIQV